MRHFVCEFITGGGLGDRQLPPGLAMEGDLMLKALLHDLVDSGEEDLLTTRDTRLPDLDINIDVQKPTGDIWSCWSECMSYCDAAWLIAPETHDALYELTLMSENKGCVNYGCTSNAVRITGSKSRTLDILEGRGLPCAKTWVDTGHLPASVSGWVIKPDVGVGGEDCFYFQNSDEIHAWEENNDINNFIIQEYIVGIPASLSLLCHNGQCFLLSCNRQLFAFSDGKGQLNGVIINGLADQKESMQWIAGMIAGCIPGISGYIGVDLIMTDRGPVILEINPRLTTSYIGLHESLGKNPAELIMTTNRTGKLPDLNKIDNKAVRIELNKNDN